MSKRYSGKPSKKVKSNNELEAGKEKIKRTDNFVSDLELENAFPNWSHHHWLDKKPQVFDGHGIEIITYPFRVGIIENFLPSPLGTYDLRGELLSVHRKLRGNDLMQLQESVVDLTQITPRQSHSQNIECIELFRKDMLKVMRPWLEKITGLQLSETKLSLRCSMYTDKDHLLCHNDKVEDRKVAFILYLSKDWKSSYGGALDLYNVDDHGQPDEVVRSINPDFNTFVFFEVTDTSYHSVREIIGDVERFSVNGWFHARKNQAEENDPPPRPERVLHFLDPKAQEVDLSLWIRKSRLENVDFIQLINKTIELFSFCGVKAYLKQNAHRTLSRELTSDEITWTKQGPPDERNYEVALESTLPEGLKRFYDAFKTVTFCSLLNLYSDLDLIPNASCKPKLTLELQRWSQGCYTLLHDGQLKRRNDSTARIDPENEDSSEEEDYSSEKMSEDIIGATYEKVSTKPETSARASSSNDVGEDFITNYDGDCVGQPMPGSSRKNGKRNTTEKDDEPAKRAKIAREEDEAESESAPGTLDVVMYFHAGNAPKDMTLNYVDPEKEDGVCLTLPVQDNSLFVVYREEGVVRHHEYVDHTCEGYFYSLVCSYHE